MSHVTDVKSVPITDIRALRAAIIDLKKQKIKCSLAAHAVPRMWFKDQLKKQMGRANEECEYVLQLHDCPYDVGLIKQENGSYLPVFDDMTGAPPDRKTPYKHASVRAVLGCDPGEVKHDPEMDMREFQVACQISKFLMGYSKAAAVNAAVDAGYIVESASLNSAGEPVIVIQT